MLQVLPLLLLEAWILFVDNIQAALPPHDLALCTALFNRCPYLHCNEFYILYFIAAYLYLKMILPLVRS